MDVTRGLGAGGKPEMGRLAAEESIEAITAMVAGADLVFVSRGVPSLSRVPNAHADR